MSQDDALTWPTIYTDLIAGRDLEQAAVEWAMAQIMDGAATPAQIAGFLVGLRAKGESVEEMHGLAEVMLSRAHRIEVEGPSLDIVGTGGDRAHTVNISTMSSIVAAAAGVRAMSGRPGKRLDADLLRVRERYLVVRRVVHQDRKSVV